MTFVAPLNPKGKPAVTVNKSFLPSAKPMAIAFSQALAISSRRLNTPNGRDVTCCSVVQRAQRMWMCEWNYQKVWLRV